MLGMLGINDTFVLAAYLLCIGSTLLCAVFGLVMWNRGQDSAQREDVQWAAQEKRIEREL